MKYVKYLVLSLVAVFSIGLGVFVYLNPTTGIKQNTWTYPEVEKIYDNLQRVAGFSTPPLVIIDDPVLNAWTDGTNITLTTGILKTLNSADEVAEVLGHEMSHNILGHVGENTTIYEKDYFDYTDALVSQQHEAAADLYGTALMMRAGYDVCQAPNWFKMLLNQSGDRLGSDHPGYGFRIWYMTYPQCK